MTYRELIEKLLPYADEEINMSVSTKKVPADYNDTTNWNEITIQTLRFYRNTEESNDIIVGCIQKSNDDFENIEPVKEI